MLDAADQARQLADLFSQMAETVDAYRTQHFEKLTADERNQLEQVIQHLDDIHDQFTAIAIQDTLNSIREDLGQIRVLTTQAEQSLRHLNTVAEIVKVISATAELGQDIFTADYGAIPQAIKDLAQAVAETADKNPSSAAQPGTERPD